MLLSLQLPPLARRKILEYTTDNSQVYGGSRTQRLKYFERVKRATPEELRRLWLDLSKYAGCIQRVKREQLI
jgi:hypothetical protein